MKEKILEILKDKVSIRQSGYMNCYADLEGLEDAAEEMDKFLGAIWNAARAQVTTRYGDYEFRNVEHFFDYVKSGYKNK